jgi:hypothetical protein
VFSESFYSEKKNHFIKDLETRKIEQIRIMIPCKYLQTLAVLVTVGALSQAIHTVTELKTEKYLGRWYQVYAE